MKPVIRSIISVFLIILFHSVASALSEAPELSVNDVRIGDRDSARKFLSGYGPTFGEDGRPAYFFYNKFATQVMKLTAASWEDRYFITEIEVFAVGRSYKRKHFQLKDIGYFKTGEGVFIGYRQSAMSVISGFAIGVNDPGGKNRVRMDKVEELYGEPDEMIEDGETVSFVYADQDVEIPGLKDTADYEAIYEFTKNKLRRYRISIKLPPSASVSGDTETAS